MSCFPCITNLVHMLLIQKLRPMKEQLRTMKGESAKAGLTAFEYQENKNNDYNSGSQPS